MNRIYLLLVVLLSLSWFPAKPVAPRADLKEYDVKSVLMTKITRFIAWPVVEMMSDEDGEEAAFKLGVLGVNPFGKNLEQVFRDKTVDKKTVEVVYFKTIADMKPVAALFVTQEMAKQGKEIRKKIGTHPTLLIGESNGFAKDTGHINFYKRSGSIRFEVNANRLTTGKFKVSSKFLKLARIVK